MLATMIPSVQTTVNSLMFAGIVVCVFETKPCSQGLIFVVIHSDLVNYPGTRIMFAGIYFCDLKLVMNFTKLNPRKH